MASSPEPMAPVLIGGSPRSGTHIAGRLVAADPARWMVPFEARFHASPGGLADLLSGSVSLEAFLDRCRGEWWGGGRERRRGLHELLDEETYERLLATFAERWPSDPITAGRELLAGLLDRPAYEHGARGWVDVTGANVRSAPGLIELLPEAKVIHMVRDGRAVAASILNRDSMTDDHVLAMRWWTKRIRAADAAIRRLPDGVALTVWLDDLCAHDRDGTFDAIVRHLGIADPAPMREFFDREVDPAAAHVGAWRDRLDRRTARRLDRRYRGVLRRLRREGVDWLRSA